MTPPSTASGNDAHASALRSVLRELNASAADVEASALMSTDGFMIAAVLGDKADPDRFAAMCASLLALTDRAAQEISRGRLKQVLIEGETGLMLLVQVGTDALLAIAARPTINLGMLFIEARKTALKLATKIRG